jgi:Tol biopolymer transport system component
MTSERFESQLPFLLEDLYLGPPPDYRDEVLAAATRRGQRPAWAVPGRWIPMADLARRSTLVPRLPWRTLSVALIILALLVAAAFVLVGSRQIKLPPPFGVARNGQITYAANGDIYAADPVTGDSRPIVAGDALDRNPIFSRDGMRIAFLRQLPNETGKFQLVVVGRDGGAVTIASSDAVQTPDLFDWSPDSAALVIGTADARLIRYDLKGGPGVVLAEGVHVQDGAFRPPDGAQILYQPDTTETALMVMNADGTGKHLVFKGGLDQQGGAISGMVRWSPDGRRIAFGLNGPNDTYARINVINADGTGLTLLDNETGTLVDNDLVWSPDGTHIAFNRWRQTTGTEWDIQPIGVVPVTGGQVRSVGSTPVSDGALFDYSPDGMTILSLPGTLVGAPTWSANATGSVASPDLIDVAAGTPRRLDVAVGSDTSWQRLAP